MLKKYKNDYNLPLDLNFKPSLIYCTSRCFLDTDIPIVNELHKKIDLYFLVSYARNENNKDKSDESKIYINKQVRTIFIHGRGRFRHPRQIVYAFLLFQWLIKIKPKIIFVEMIDSPYFVFFYPILRLKGIKILQGIHDVIPHSGSENLIIQFFDFLKIKLSNYQLVFSENQKKIFYKIYKISPLKIDLPYKNYFLDHYKFNSIQRESNTILFFGTIRKNKGLEVLIKAAETIGNEIINFKVIIAGKCDNFEYYEQFIHNYKLFEINTNFIPDNEVGKYFLRSQMVILPYNDATQSGLLLIANSFGCPVIASKVSGLQEYIKEGVNGIFFRKGDYIELSQKIKYNLLNRELLKKMQQEAPKFIKERYSAFKVADDLNKIIYRITNN